MDPGRTPRHADERLARVIEFFEALQPQHLQRLREVYTDDASFKDPFNEVHSTGSIERIFRHMFDTLDDPRFVVTQAMAQDDQAFLTWDFHLQLRGAPLVIRGATHLRFAPDGRVALHRDYWDAAEELYEKLPLLGALMRWLKRRARA
ncbi:MAG: nuclear transport factor 2 family protein [Rubrivivax sp.]